MISTTEQHEPTDACNNDHCYTHHVDEPGTGYIVCPECWHVYQTARELRREYRRNRPGIEWREWRWLPAYLWRLLTVRASKIPFCPLCMHDF